MIHDDLLGTIRDAWPVRLQRLGRELPGDLVVAFAAPGTSSATADAIAARCLADLERSGPLARDAVLVSYAPTFGTSVAMLAAARGLGCIVLVDDAATREERNRVRAYGAEVRAVPVRSDPDDRSALAIAARRVATQTPGAVLVEKQRTEAGPGDEASGRALVDAAGDRLWAVVGGDRDELVLEGVRRALRGTGRDAAVVSLGFDGAAWTGSTRGAPLVIGEREALSAARRLAREEGILGGAAVGGAAVAAALRLASGAPQGRTVVALVPAADRGDLLTAYDDDWWAEHHGGDGDAKLTAAAILGRKEHGPTELVTLPHDATVVDAIHIMRDLEVSQIPVVRDDRIVGTIREDQVIDLLLHAAERKDGPVEEVMEDPLPEIDEDAAVDDLQSLLVRGGSAVIVRRRDGTRDILTKYDLIHALARG